MTQSPDTKPQLNSNASYHLATEKIKKTTPDEGKRFEKFMSGFEAENSNHTLAAVRGILVNIIRRLK